MTPEERDRRRRIARRFAGDPVKGRVRKPRPKPAEGGRHAR